MSGKSIKVLSLSPNPSDGISWYRCSGPLNRMTRDYDDIEYIEWGAQDVDWDMLTKFDVLFINRPHKTWQLRIMNKAIWLGLKVWVDFDDLLWDLPKHHKLYHDYMSQSALNEMHGLLKNLNKDHCVVSVATGELFREVEKINPELNIVIIPNAIDEKIFGFPAFKNDTTMLAWRGGFTHEHDLLLHRRAIDLAMQKYSTEFIMYNPTFLTYGHPTANHTSPGGLLEYFHYLNKKKWRAFFFCLEDNSFNRCKSNIGWLEATYAGAVTIAPDWEEWNFPGVVNYVGGQGLYDAIHEVMKKSEPARFDLWWNSADYISKNLILKVTNQMRYELLHDLLGKPMPMIAVPFED